MENPILSTLPSMSRSTSSITRGDVTSFLQCLRFDPRAILMDHEFNRSLDFKRLACLALGVQPDDFSPSGSANGKLASLPPEELKQLKLGLREISIKARECVKTFSEALSVFNKCFPGIPSRKRSRSDVLSGEQSNDIFLYDLSAMGPTLGNLSHTIASRPELDQQEPEERTKNAIPNKRTRTSMADPRSDLRPNTPARTTGNADGDKEGSKPLNNGATQAEDQTLPLGCDNWEKSKMKKKRSGIKADAPPSSSATKPIDGYEDPKQGSQLRHLSDSRSRLRDSVGSRPGAVNGIVGVVKADGTPQLASLGMRSSILRSDQDSASAIQERRDRITSSDKEIVNSRSVGKTNPREELNSSSPTLSSKLNAASRASRSTSVIIPKLSPVVERENATTAWELSHCTSKNPSSIGAHNRKRTSSTRSSSPPVAQWASQRPQKMSRTSRRTNFVPNVTSNDKTPSLDTVSDAAGNENGSVFPRHLYGNSPRQVRLTGDRYPSTALSESEDSGTPEVKSRDKGKNSDEINNKSGKNAQKIATLVVPPRKNNVARGDETGNGIRKQGRTGRGFTSMRSLVPVTMEKHGSMGTAKPLRSAKLGIDKAESKAGRPPTRKLSDRKAYTREKHTAVNASADILVGSGDGHEELLAAANEVADSAYTFSSAFWRRMEQFFRDVFDVNIDYIKQQGNFDICESKPNPVPSDNLLRYRTVLEQTRSVAKTKYSELIPGTVVSSDIPICQILLSALISEDEIEEPSGSENEGPEFNSFSYGSDELDGDIERDSFSQQSLHSFEHVGLAGFGGNRIAANGRSDNEMEHDLLDKDNFCRPGSWISSGADHSLNDFLPDQAAKLVLSCSDFEYKNMSINEKALLEIQSIGLLSEPPYLAQTGDDEISREISKLEDKYHEQACEKKSFLDRLLKSSMKERELQEKDFEQSALEKLVTMAYQKYMSCWGPNAPGGKSASGKIAKQAALVFVKQTLERCREYEVTGKSCFSEPLFREVFQSRLSHLSDAQQLDATRDGEYINQYANVSRCSMEGRVAGTLATNAVGNYDMYSSSAFISENYLSEKTIGKEDTWSTRVKKKELLLKDIIGGVVGSSPGVSSGIGTSILSSAKGKRSDRDREGKGNNREMLSRNGTAKIGRTTSGNVKGEKKSKLKPKQKTTQLSALNGIVGKMSEPRSLPSLPRSVNTTLNGSGREKNSLKLNSMDNSEAIDFSSLPMDGDLDVPDDLGDQGQDIGSWLNIEDDGLQDDDFMGLEIPMDDLSELNMMV